MDEEVAEPPGRAGDVDDDNDDPHEGIEHDVGRVVDMAIQRDFGSRHNIMQFAYRVGGEAVLCFRVLHPRETISWQLRFWESSQSCIPVAIWPGSPRLS